MGKIMSLGKKYWYVVAIGAFVVGAGSVANAKGRTTQIIADPKSVMAV